jgi:hypothetical protein
MATMDVNAAGGTARWNKRRGEPPISFSARWMAACRSAAASLVSDLISAIGTFIDHWNEHPRPFSWTKDADEILGSIEHAKT